MKPAIIIVDMQKDFFVEPNRHELLNSQILPNLKKLLEFARKIHLPIIHVITLYKQDGSNWPRARKAKTIWCVEGTEGATIIEGLAPRQNEITIVKTRFDAFFSTNLEDILRKWEVDTVILTGVTIDVCVRTTALGAYYRDFNVIVPKDCTCSYIDSYEHAVRYLEILANAEVLSSTDIIEKLKSSIPKIRNKYGKTKQG